MKDIVAGCFQFAIEPAGVDANLAKVETALGKLADKGCSLAVLPEMWSCSFPYRVLSAMAGKTPRVVENIRLAARQKKLVIIGSLPTAAGNSIYNTSYIIDSDGEVAGTYSKVHLFSLFGEDKNFS